MIVFKTINLYIMHKVPLLILFLFVTVITRGQDTRYDTCQYLKQYTGEWISINGNDTIRIYLRTHRDYNPSNNLISDNIYGWHEYKRGNTIIESNYQYRFMILPYNYFSDSITIEQSSILMSPQACHPDSVKIMGSITDYLQAKQMKIVTATLDPTRTIMTWKQEHSTGYGSLNGAYGMTLPRQFILKKQ
jgi:hypothetical protein